MNIVLKLIGIPKHEPMHCVTPHLFTVETLTELALSSLISAILRTRLSTKGVYGTAQFSRFRRQAVFTPTRAFAHEC